MKPKTAVELVLKNGAQIKTLTTQTASEVRRLFDSGVSVVYFDGFVSNPDLKSIAHRVTLSEVAFVQISEIDDSNLIKPSTSIIRS